MISAITIGIIMTLGMLATWATKKMKKVRCKLPFL